MKTLKVFVIIVTVFFNSITHLNAQGVKFSKNVFSIGDSIHLKIGDNILINIPYAQARDFSFIKKEKKGLGLNKLAAIGNVGGAIGSAVGSIGGMTGNFNILKTGSDIMSAGNVATSIGYAGVAIDRLNISKSAKKLVGKKMLIVSFQKDGNLDSSPVYALATLEGDKRLYKITLYQAFVTGEVIFTK